MIAGRGVSLQGALGPAGQLFEPPRRFPRSEQCPLRDELGELDGRILIMIIIIIIITTIVMFIIIITIMIIMYCCFLVVNVLVDLFDLDGRILQPRASRARRARQRGVRSRFAMRFPEGGRRRGFRGTKGVPRKGV